MRKLFVVILMVTIMLPGVLCAQQRVVVMSRCGGVDTVIIPTIVDNDSDGMDDHLEQKLLNRFMPVVIQFDNENCPGPALNGSGDTNLIACHIFPYPQQYATTSNLASVLTHPVPVVAAHALYPGLIWYDPLIKVNTAVLYGQDCGFLSGHKADVEGFNFSIKYIGPDTLAGWMYDTVMQHWMGATIQSISHASTLCQQTETYPYKSALFPNGLDTVYASPDKHGNYLTISGCGASIICNPGCGGRQKAKNIVNVNLGEPNASLVPDLGAYYPAYAGSDPWSTNNFLGGGAGTIRDKMLLPLTSDFMHGQTLTQAQICSLYTICYGPSGSAALEYTCAGTGFWFYGQIITQSGVYQHILTNSYGCDSTIRVNLSVVAHDSTSYAASFCSNGNFNFNGRLLTSAGFFTDTLSNIHGCDSIVTLALSAYLPDTYAYSDSFCSGANYSFNGRQLTAPGIYTDTLINRYGCDSVVTLALGQKLPYFYSFADSFCSGSIYNFNGRPLTMPGFYSDTLTAISGCDSIVTLVLIADSVMVTWVGPDSVYVYLDTLLVGGSPPGGVYSGAGVRANIFYADSTAPGPQLITYTFSDGHGCRGSATKYYISSSTNVGIREAGLAGSILLYPNPANDKLIIQSQLFNGIEIKPVILDLAGKVIDIPFNRQEAKVVFDTGFLAGGMYWLQVNLNGILISKKFVKLNW